MSTTPPNREPPLILLLLWAILWLAMWFWAIVGPLFVLLGALSFFIDLGTIGVSISLDGPVETTKQKILFIVLGGIMGIVGIGFHLLRRYGHLRYGPEKETPRSTEAGSRPRADA